MTKLQANGGHAALEIHGLQYASSEMDHLPFYSLNANF